MAIDEADGSDVGELDGAVTSADSSRSGGPATVGEYTWTDFLDEYGTDGDAEALYDRVGGPGETPGSARWDDDREVSLTEADWERVSSDPSMYLGFHPLDTAAEVGDAGVVARRLNERFESFCDPETTPVVKDDYLWEHYKREYYYEDDGSRPRDDRGEIRRFDPGEALGFDPDRIGEALGRGASRASELANLVDERTVDVPDDLDEDAFFSTDSETTTLTNRYDLEKSVPLAKKSHFREVERYWVNKPYAFVVIFHSTKENEKKYYLIQPHLNRIEEDLVEFLAGKLRTAIKYSEEGIVVDSDEERREVIEERTLDLLERYGLYSPPSDGGTLRSLVERLDRGDDEESRAPGLLSRLLNALGRNDADPEPVSTANADEDRPTDAGGDERADTPAADAGDQLPAVADADPGRTEGTDRSAVAGREPAGELESGVEGGDETLPAPAEGVDEAALAEPSDGRPRGGVPEEADGRSSAGVAEATTATEIAEADDGETPESEGKREAGGDDGDERTPLERVLARVGIDPDSGLGAYLLRRFGEEPDGDGTLDGIAVRPEPAVLEEESRTLNEYQVEKLLYVLVRDFIGYERIDGIKHDIQVEDISCDGYNSPVFVYHGDYEQIITNIYHDRKELDDFVVKLAQRAGKGISKRRPQVDATLPDGSRSQLTLGKEVSDHGTNYTIRQFKDVPFTPIDLINWNTFSLDEMSFLWLCIENNKSLIFAGGTASGKTTSLNAVSLFIPSSSKIVSIEDTREVELPQRNWIASVTRPSFSDDGSGDIDEFDLLEAALRQRPEYIVMGEIRGEEGRTLFQVMSTGHTTYTTFHADSVGEVLKRFTTDPINVSKTMFTALDLVCIQSSTRVEGRKVRRNKSLTEINHYDPENDEINVQDVYQWQAETDEFLKMGNSNTLEEIQFDRGWSTERLEGELFKRQAVLAYLIDRGLNTYTQVAATFQAFINDQETILTLMANDDLERSLEDLREMESVLIDIDPGKEEMVPRPDPDGEGANLATEILARAEEELFDEYRDTDADAGDIAEALTATSDSDVTADPDGETGATPRTDAPSLDEGGRTNELDDAGETPALDVGDERDVDRPTDGDADGRPDAPAEPSAGTRLTGATDGERRDEGSPDPTDGSSGRTGPSEPPATDADEAGRAGAERGEGDGTDADPVPGGAEEFDGPSRRRTETTPEDGDGRATDSVDDVDIDGDAALESDDERSDPSTFGSGGDIGAAVDAHGDADGEESVGTSVADADSGDPFADDASADGDDGETEEADDWTFGGFESADPDADGDSGGE